MYLKKSYNKKTGRTQLFIVEAYRDKDRKPKSKVIKTLGYLDVLEKEYDDPISYFSELAKKMTAERKAAIDRIKLMIDPDESTPSGGGRNICFGIAAIMKVYNDFGFDSFFSEISKSTKTEYNQNNIFKFAVCTKALFPNPSETDFSNIRFLFSTDNLTPSDYYRTVDLLTKSRMDLIRWIFRRIPEYSFSNQDHSKIAEPIYCYFSGYEFDSFSHTSGNALSKLFLPGCSSSAFYGLFTDANDFPLYYALLNGSMSEAKIRSSITAQLNDSVIKKRTIAVAGSMDIDYYKISSHLLQHNNGYIFAYPLYNAEEELKEYALNIKREDFRSISFNDHAVFIDEDEFSKPFIDDFNNNELRYNERVVSKKIKISEHFSDISEKQLIIYSPSFANNCRTERARLIDLAKEIIADPECLKKPGTYSARKYIQNLSFDKNNTFNGNMAKLKLNTKLIEKEALLDGYIVIVTSEADADLNDIYNHLIALVSTEAFLSYPRTTPVGPAPYENYETMQQSDFFIRYIGFILCRIIENKLGKRFDVSKISESLRKCEYIHIEDDIYMLTYRDEVLDAIGEVLGIDFTKRFRRLKDIMAMF